jgi:hypothetical protein
MRYKPVLWTLPLVLLVFAVVHGSEDETSKIEKLAKEVQEAVLHSDIDRLMRYVHSSGTVFIDTAYTREEISRLMRDEDSWLYKHLFVGRSSVRSYFRNAKNLKIKVHRQSDIAMFVSYESSNYEKWMESCFIRIDGRWYFNGIFSCQ